MNVRHYCREGLVWVLVDRAVGEATFGRSRSQQVTAAWCCEGVSSQSRSVRKRRASPRRDMKMTPQPVVRIDSERRSMSHSVGGRTTLAHSFLYSVKPKLGNLRYSTLPYSGHVQFTRRPKLSASPTTRPDLTLCREFCN